MPRLEICNCDLHWQWINWTLLFDTMEVSMVRLASLAIAQHVFQPALESALTGRPESGPELISRKIVSCEREQKLYRGEQISRKNVSRESNELPRFREKYCAHGRQKWGPTCDRDISNSAIYTTAIYRAYTVFVLFTCAVLSFFWVKNYFSVIFWLWQKHAFLSDALTYGIDGFVQDCSISTQYISSGDTAVLHKAIYVCIFNSLRPCDAIWWKRTGSTLVQVMACCLMEPSHYMNQCWLIISKVLWRSCEDNFTRDTSAINHQNYLENYF